jgi:toxin HigB-1
LFYITLDVINKQRYDDLKISSFKCKETQKIFHGQFSRKLPQEIQKIAARKLEQLHAASILDTLRIPPGNRLEALSGDYPSGTLRDRQGQHSIRINSQWRLCFVWRD